MVANATIIPRRCACNAERIPFYFINLRLSGYINEPTLADAIMDRLSGNAHRLELKGESLRKKNNFEKND